MTQAAPFRKVLVNEFDGEGCPAAPNVRNLTSDAALIATFNAVRDELVSTLTALLGNGDDAQDAAQDAFIKCWRARDTIANVRNLRAWIFQVGKNAAKDLRRTGWNRRAKPLMGEEGSLTARETVPAQALEEREEIEQVRRAILDLRVEEKEVFLLRQHGGLPYAQIAAIRNSPVCTVRTQMRTALQKLRRVVADIPEPVVTEAGGVDVLPLPERELDCLPEKYRVLIVLCDLESKTRKEVARQLDIPEGTVAGRLARARAMLAERSSRRGLTVAGGARQRFDDLRNADVVESDHQALVG
jgi:RNA polymerase sigma-70 factor, ECF subfamily